MALQPSNSFSIQLLDANFNPVGQPQTLAQLGIESLTFDENNLAADVWSVTVGGLDIDAKVIWPYGQTLVVLRPDGTRCFFGRVEPWTRDGQFAGQSHSCRLVNPWWYLANKIYQQRYVTGQFSQDPVAGAVPTPKNYVTYSTPRVVLNVLWNPPAGFDPTPGVPPIFVDKPPGFNSATTGQQIQDALQWAILQGAPIKIGQIDPNTMPFSDYQKGITCADVIKKMFRFEPDFIMDWDYSTVPFPTVHFRKMASLTAILIDLTVPSVIERIKITERPDWQKSYVHINYDQTNTQGGSQFLQIFDDLYPNPIPAGVEAAFRGVDLYCDLSGSSVSSTAQSANFASLPQDYRTWDTWKKWKPDLDPAVHPEIKTVEIQGDIQISSQDEFDPGGIPQGYNGACQHEIIDGAWADWIPASLAQRVRITGTALVIKSKGTAGTTSELVPISHDVTLVSINTAGISKTFTSTQSNITAFAEVPPLSLAQAMWTSWSNLAIEGSIMNVEAVIGTTITRSNCLNFKTGNGVDWSNVNALVQRRSGDIATGTTQIQFGAPLHITGNELIDVIRATRFRVTTIDLNYLFGGPLPGASSSTVRFARKTHARHAQSGTPHPQTQVISGLAAPGVADPYIKHEGGLGITSWQMPAGPATFMPVTIDPSKVVGSDKKPHPVQLQEAKVCVTINGIQKQRTVIALISEVYQAPDDPA